MPAAKKPAAKSSARKQPSSSQKKAVMGAMKRRSTKSSGMEIPGGSFPRPPRRPGPALPWGGGLIGRVQRPGPGMRFPSLGGTTRPRPVRGVDQMRAHAKNVRDWKAIGELGNAYGKWLTGLAKNNSTPVRGGGGMSPGKKAKKR